MPYIVDWPGRLKEMADFVGLGEEELALIRETSSVVLEHADSLTASIYDNFLKFPESRKFLLNEDGEVDDVRLDRRKHSLARWLKGSIDFKIDDIDPSEAPARAERYRPQLEAYRDAAAEMLRTDPARVKMIVLFVTAGQAVTLSHQP